MLPFGFTYRLLSYVQKLLEQTMFYWSEAWSPICWIKQAGRVRMREN